MRVHHNNYFLHYLLYCRDEASVSRSSVAETDRWCLRDKIPLGVGSACTARVGQRLGALQPQQARFTCKVALAIQGRMLKSSCSPHILDTVSYTHLTLPTKRIV